MTRTEVERYIERVYAVQGDCPWAADQRSKVFRHRDNRKWFALLMEVPSVKFGLTGGILDVVNVKCDPLMIGSFRAETGVFPAYHMNKASWLSVALDGSAREETVKALLEISFALTAQRPKCAKGRQKRRD